MNERKVESSPLFFDSLFPSFQSTTPETVVSDYRERKRADSRAEHDSVDEPPPEPRKSPESNVEFYAEIIGKLVGTIRDGVTSLIDDVRQRKLDNQEMRNQKQQQNVTVDHQNSTRTHMNGMQMKNETGEASNLTQAEEEAAKERQEIKLTTLHPEQSEEKSELARESWNEVVQVIARRTKFKRSDKSQDFKLEMDADGGGDAQQLEIPIDFDPFDNETNERLTDDNRGWSEGNQRDDDDDTRWFAKHRNLFANLTNNHRMRKERFVGLIRQFLAAKREFLRRGDESDDEDVPRLSFAIKKGNDTIVQMTPRQFFRMFHRGSDEHAELQSKAKTMLQRAFYKYARIYLIARKGYKDARSFNRIAREHHPENEEAVTKASFLRSDEDISENLTEAADDEEEDQTFLTNDARSNLQAIEAFAILILEIFGAIFGLTLGAIGHIQGVAPF